MDSIELLLKELTEANGIPGYESEIRSIVAKRLQPFGELSRDRVGSLICRNGENGPRVMLAAHMDEIGFMVNHITEDGFIRFLPLGAWLDQVLLGQRVVIRTRLGDVPGVIGARPPHVVPQEERKKVIEQREMFIDIGARSKLETAEAGVRVGDPIAPDSTFRTVLGGSTYLGKAFDDRVGVALLIEAMRHFSTAPHPNQIFGVCTTMEEVGLRGARTSADAVNPDAAIVFEVDISGDIPGVKPEVSSVSLGGGPSLVLVEARMITNLLFRDLVIDTAADLEIPLQFSAWRVGCTDGAEIHLHGSGVPTVVLSIPTRHIHSHNGFIRRDDFDRTLRLAIRLIEKLDTEMVGKLAGQGDV